MSFRRIEGGFRWRGNRGRGGMTLVELVAALAIAGLAAAMVAGGARASGARSRAHAIDALKEGVERAALLARSGEVVTTLGVGIEGERARDGMRVRSPLPRGWRVSLEGAAPELRFTIGADGSAPDAVFALEHERGERVRLERLGLSGQWRALEGEP